MSARHPVVVAMKRRAAALLGAVVLLGAAPMAGAAEGVLYDPAPPAGSAYLRLINVGDGPASLNLGGQPFVTAGAGTASAYVVTPQGSKALEVKGRSETVQLDAGKFYSLVVPGKGAPIVDPLLSNRAKALVRLYNLTDRPELSLKTADGKVALVDAVAAGQAADRQVNGAKLSLGVYAGTEKLAVTPDVVIQRGAAYSVLAYGSGGKVKLAWVESATRLK